MSTEKRLEKLERELPAEKRRYRWLLVAVGFGVMGVALAWILATNTPTAQAQGANTEPTVIRATQFILEDESGKPRAMLNMTKDGPMLALYDENGKHRVGLGVGEKGPVLSLLDEIGNPRVGLVVEKDGPRLILRDETGKERAMLRMEKGGPGLSLLDKTGKPRASLGMDKGVPGLALWDGTGKPRAGLAVVADGPSLHLSDQKGKRRMVLGVVRDRPELTLYSEEEKPRIGLAADMYQSGLTLRDENSDTRAWLGGTKGNDVALILRDPSKRYSSTGPTGIVMFDENATRRAGLGVGENWSSLSLSMGMRAARLSVTKNEASLTRWDEKGNAIKLNEELVALLTVLKRKGVLVDPEEVASQIVRERQQKEKAGKP